MITLACFLICLVIALSSTPRMFLIVSIPVLRFPALMPVFCDTHINNHVLGRAAPWVLYQHIVYACSRFLHLQARLTYRDAHIIILTLAGLCLVPQVQPLVSWYAWYEVANHIRWATRVWPLIVIPWIVFLRTKTQIIRMNSIAERR